MDPVAATVRPPWRMILAMAGVAFAITLLRLLGELRGWSPRWFGSEAGGGGALVGIGWLIPVFGMLVGRRLARSDQGPASLRQAWCRVGIGLAILLTGFTLATQVLGTTVPSMFVAAICSVAGAVVAAPGWPILARASFAFALLCRLPILVITPLAIACDWGTHYEKLAPGSPELGPLARTLILCIAQLTFWFPITILGAQLAALLSLPRRLR